MTEKLKDISPNEKAFLVKFKGTKQVSIDDYERISFELIVDETTTISDIFRWYAKDRGLIDPSQMQLSMPDSLNIK